MRSKGTIPIDDLFNHTQFGCIPFKFSNRPTLLEFVRLRQDRYNVFKCTRFGEVPSWYVELSNGQAIGDGKGDADTSAAASVPTVPEPADDHESDDHDEEPEEAGPAPPFVARRRPVYTIGIVGASGAGKISLAHQLLQWFGKYTPCIPIEYNCFHKTVPQVMRNPAKGLGCVPDQYRHIHPHQIDPAVFKTNFTMLHEMLATSTIFPDSWVLTDASYNRRVNFIRQAFRGLEYGFDMPVFLILEGATLGFDKYALSVCDQIVFIHAEEMVTGTRRYERNNHNKKCGNWKYCKSMNG